MQIWTDEKSGRVNWLREKHYSRKISQEGYRRPADNGDGARKRHKVKMNDKVKAAIYASQPKRVMVLDAQTGKTRMVTVPK